MKSTAVLVLGMVLLALGAQGAIRLLVDHANAGLLGWVPGGFAVQLSCYLVVTAAGVALAVRGKSAESRASSGR
ncbi:hypothetical protein [Saccharothrix coeruleofusca]|uniref:Uncharacterized protein n=1 Tax=Saccharothrix coeruleofusca TaxID=33919 RepID=A0A918ECZ9_9PSEU|nr:hypothetical protein [Saccharothrix coeruleofusca]GGP44033.1 hypothetical protein GCM10010185_14650 [Saccharothrix coeruleofusca]